MDSRSDDKLDKISEHLASIDVTLGKQSVILEEHVRRSNALEMKLAPVERHVAMVQGALKAMALLGAIIGAIHTILKLKGL